LELSRVQSAQPVVLVRRKYDGDIPFLPADDDRLALRCIEERG
jgi:hypothetical protein